MPRSYIPGRDSDLSTYAGNIARLVGGSPTSFGFSVAEGEALTNTTLAFSQAMARLVDPVTRSPVDVGRKNDARKLLVASLQSAVGRMQAWPGMTDDKRRELGITVRKQTRTRIGSPTSAPGVRVRSVVGRRINLLLWDVATGRGRKPEGVQQAWLFVYVGNQEPTDFGAYKLRRATSRCRTHVMCPEHVGPGVKVWVTAMWASETGVHGPACQPVTAWTNHDAMEWAVGGRQ